MVFNLLCLVGLLANKRQCYLQVRVSNVAWSVTTCSQISDTVTCIPFSPNQHYYVATYMYNYYNLKFWHFAIALAKLFIDIRKTSFYYRVYTEKEEFIVSYIPCMYCYYTNLHLHHSRCACCATWQQKDRWQQGEHDLTETSWLNDTHSRTTVYSTLH